jgi:hypothetical protein
MISSGCAACPEAEITYLGFSSVGVDVLPVDDGGKVDGSVLYVYGRVVAVGNEIKGETVRGICASSGWDSPSRSASSEIYLLFKEVSRGDSLLSSRIMKRTTMSTCGVVGGTHDRKQKMVWE